ncbi:MAG: pancreas/duodenum homeobox protein 1 [Desulfobacterium sp.]|nr:pancreas/duodenum homeobox protein 1 [Desulfobacterium sp.]
MNMTDAIDLFTKEKLDQIFPANRADTFFEALYGDVSEGAYDISLEFSRIENDTLIFEFHLKQRPGKCLACNLTHGLPLVFSRHPVINLDGLIKEINTLLNGKATCTGWDVKQTKEINRTLHLLPVAFHITE